MLLFIRRVIIIAIVLFLITVMFRMFAPSKYEHVKEYINARITGEKEEKQSQQKPNQQQERGEDGNMHGKKITNNEKKAGEKKQEKTEEKEEKQEKLKTSLSTHTQREKRKFKVTTPQPSRQDQDSITKQKEENLIPLLTSNTGTEKGKDTMQRIDEVNKEISETSIGKKLEQTKETSSFVSETVVPDQPQEQIREQPHIIENITEKPQAKQSKSTTKKTISVHKSTSKKYQPISKQEYVQSLKTQNQKNSQLSSYDELMTEYIFGTLTDK